MKPSIDLPANAPPDGKTGNWFGTQRPPVQAAISCALFVVLWIIPAMFSPHWGTTIEFAAFSLSVLCFLPLIATAARTAVRRSRAVTIGAISALLGIASELMMLSHSDALVALAPILFFTYPLGLVAAWGVARRRRTGWIAGMLIAAPATITTQYYLAANRPGWMLFWAITVGVGCLIAWLIEKFAQTTVGAKFSALLG